MVHDSVTFTRLQQLPSSRFTTTQLGRMPPVGLLLLLPLVAVLPGAGSFLLPLLAAAAAGPEVAEALVRNGLVCQLPLGQQRHDVAEVAAALHHLRVQGAGTRPWLAEKHLRGR